MRWSQDLRWNGNQRKLSGHKPAKRERTLWQESAKWCLNEPGSFALIPLMIVVVWAICIAIACCGGGR